MPKYKDVEDRRFDSAALAELSEFGQVNGEPQMLNDLLEIFYDTTPKRLEKLSLAAKHGDFQSMLLLAHSLKSSCGYLGVLRMRSLCIRLEEMCRVQQIADAEILVQAITAEYSQVKIELERTAAEIRELARRLH